MLVGKLNRGLSVFARYVYFFVIGWWMGLFAAIAGSVLCASIIGLPLGTMLLNKLPTIVFMREEGEPCPWGYTDHRHQREPMPFVIRVLWFFVLGWSLGMLLITFGYLISLTIIGIPVGIYLLNRVPLVMTLSRAYD